MSEGMQRFFEGLRTGRKVGVPKLIERKKFRSLSYPQYGKSCHISKGRVYLPKLGDFRIRGWQKLRGAKKSLTLKFKQGYFWLIVMCQMQEKDAVRSYKDLRGVLPEAGIDPGLKAVLTDSFGKSYGPPKPLKQAQSTLKAVQRQVSRKFEHRKVEHMVANKERSAKGESTILIKEAPVSNRLKKSIKKLAKAHTKVERTRLDVARKTARQLEKKFSRIAVEEHGLTFMQKNRRQAKAAADVAIGIQKQALRSAFGPGRYHEASNRRTGIGGNSQTCLCGASVPKTLSERWHACPVCGLQGPRDQMSAVIVQNETFGSLPDEATAGFAGLELSLKMLQEGRGARKAAMGESPSGQSAKTVERAAKRQTPPAIETRNTTGAQAKVAGKTGGHERLCALLAA